MDAKAQYLTALESQEARRAAGTKLLDALDEFLVVNDPAAQELWDILCALRGPDVPELARKSASTCIIRRRALPRCADRPYILSACFVADSQFEAGTSDRAYHFTSHAWNAYRALNKWAQ